MYIEIMNDSENGALLQYFLVFYLWDLLILAVCIFWHVFFLIGMGAAVSAFLLAKIVQFNASDEAQ